MRESVFRKKFNQISKIFFYWKSAQKIYEQSHRCKREALLYFNNPRKIDAIIQIANHVYERGFYKVKEAIRREDIDYIIKLPYMGPATSYHFAKNIGLEVVKPDRHLKRVAKVTGYSSPHALCSDIAEVTGEKISVVDLVIWRFATLQNNYLDFFIDARVLPNN